MINPIGRGLQNTVYNVTGKTDNLIVPGKDVTSSPRNPLRLPVSLLSKILKKNLIESKAYNSRLTSGYRYINSNNPIKREKRKTVLLQAVLIMDRNLE